MSWAASATSLRARSRSGTASPRTRFARTSTTGTAPRSGSVRGTEGETGSLRGPFCCKGAGMPDPADKPNRHTIADHRLANDLAHVHDGDADHDHDDFEDGPIEDN